MPADVMPAAARALEITVSSSEPALSSFPTPLTACPRELALTSGVAAFACRCKCSREFALPVFEAATIVGSRELALASCSAALGCPCTCSREFALSAFVAALTVCSCELVLASSCVAALVDTTAAAFEIPFGSVEILKSQLATTFTV